MSEFYTINDVALMSGLTTRTVRNYIRMGILGGEKINGVWQFTPEEISGFFSHPGVWPSIQAKKRAAVFDFIADRWKNSNQMCVILDLPCEDGEKIADFFTKQCNMGRFGSDLRFFYECTDAYPRVILKGQAEDIFLLLELFHKYNGAAGGSHEV